MKSALLRPFLGIVLVVCTIVAVRTQHKFEVASIKRNMSGDSRASITGLPLHNLWGEIVQSPGRLSVINAPLREIIARAYGINPLLERFSVIGGPEQILSTRFDIIANPPEEIGFEQNAVMLRALLEERFRLRVHSEIREVPIYELTTVRAGKLGPRLRQSVHDCIAFFKSRLEEPDLVEPVDNGGRPLCRRNYEFNTPGPGAQTITYASSIDFLVSRIQPDLDRPVANSTGLIGSYEWSISYSRDGSLESNAPIIFRAVEEQLGLRLERKRGPHEVIVIDSVSMPTPN